MFLALDGKPISSYTKTDACLEANRGRQYVGQYGRWMFLDGVFTMDYCAFKQGRIEWKPHRIQLTPKSMGGEKTIPQTGPAKGKELGVFWSAGRSGSKHGVDNKLRKDEITLI